MKYILTIEQLFQDVFKFDGDNEYLKKKLNSTFEDNAELLSNVYIDEYNKEIKIIWNNTKKHSIVKRIKERTFIKSTIDFNTMLRRMITNMFVYHFDDINEYCIMESKNNITITLKPEEYNNIYIIVSLNYDKLFNDKTNIIINTILPQHTNRTDLNLEV